MCHDKIFMDLFNKPYLAQQIFHNASFWDKNTFLLQNDALCDMGLVHCVIVPQVHYLVLKSHPNGHVIGCSHGLFDAYLCMIWNDYLITITDRTDRNRDQFPKLLDIWVPGISDEIPSQFRYSAIIVRMRMAYGPCHGLLADITGQSLGSVSIYNKKSLGCFRENSRIIAY